MPPGKGLKRCRTCGQVWEGQTQPGFHERCVDCEDELHACLNCRHHDPRQPNQCRVPNTEPVVHRDRANLCEEFDFRTGPIDEVPRRGTAPTLDDLLGGGGATPQRPSLDDLLGG